MSSIRNTVALFLITVTLGPGIAIAQPTQVGDVIVTRESATFVQAKELGTARVMLSLEGSQYVVNEGLADAARLPWRGDAICHVRLKTFSVKHPDGENGTKTISQSLAKTATNVHGIGSLQSFPLELLRNRCLDIANVPPGKPFKTAVNAPEESEHELRDLQKVFNQRGGVETFIDGAQHPNAVLLLTAQCSNADGSKLGYQVNDKQVFPKVTFRCCGGGDICGE